MTFLAGTVHADVRLDIRESTDVRVELIIRTTRTSQLTSHTRIFIAPISERISLRMSVLRI